MYDIEIAFIGGSGLYKIPNFKNEKWVQVKPKFGSPSSDICIGVLKKKKIAFLPRHSLNHTISPSFINYRANIEALKMIGAKNIISLSAVGSLREDFRPGDFVLVDQFIDKTYLREKTFFDRDLVVHVPFSSPVCLNLKNKISSALSKLRIQFHGKGLYICIEGPQFSTLAESELFRSWGCDVVGMTNMPEAKLSMEAGICYSSIGMVTDYDCWHPEHENVSVEQIISTLNKNSKKAFKLIEQLCSEDEIVCEEKIQKSALNSIITNPSKIKESTKKRLSNILKL